MNNPGQIIKHITEFIGNRYAPEEYPALRRQYELWNGSELLAGRRILVGTPIFTNTLLQYRSLLAAGADMTVAVNDEVPYDRALLPCLKQWGIPCVTNAKTGEYDCILDCAGKYAGMSATYGYAELTRSGFYQYQKQCKPVILVDDSRIKAIETCLGTGDGFQRAMRQLGHGDFAGRKLCLFGYGKVGRGIAYYAHKAGARVTVIDDWKVNLPDYLDFVDRHCREKVQETLGDAWCVVTATGIRGAMCGNGAAEVLRNGPQLIAAMGIEDEWGGELPAERILNHGVALNFMLEEPTRLCFIDPTMAIFNAAALELLGGNLMPGIQKIAPELEAFYWRAVEDCGLITKDLKEIGL